jgi:hypothetical protein
MPQISSLSFNVSFEPHNPNRVGLTNTTPSLPAGFVGIFKVTQPDGYVRNGDINTPDVTNVVSSCVVTLVPDSAGQLQQGQYIIEFIGNAPGYLSTSFIRTFTLQYTAATISLRNDFDIFTPQLAYTDISNYSVSGWTISSGPTRKWDATSPTTGTISGTNSSIDIRYNNKYYAENYTIRFEVNVAYASQAYPWLTITHTRTQTTSVTACIPKSLEDLTQAVEALREESNASCGGDWAKFEKANALYAHLLNMLRLVLIAGQQQSGFFDVYQQLLTYIQNGSVACTTIGQVIPPYDFSDYESSIYDGQSSYCQLVGDGVNTTYRVNHQLGDTCVVVQVYEVATGKQVFCDLAVSTINSIDITFYEPPTLNQYRVVAVAGAIGLRGQGFQPGGLTGQILRKKTNADFDTEWADVTVALPLLVPYAGATQDVFLGEFGIEAGYVRFDTTPTAVPAVPAVMSWNDADGTVDLKLKGNSVSIQLGQEMVSRVVNKTGANLLASQYKAVRVRKVSEGGAQGQRLAVVLAQANTEFLSTDMLGIVTENISNNQEGFITTFGAVKNIDTTGSLQGETWVDGDILFLSPTVPGGLTNVKPSAPDHLSIVGYVEYSHQNNGKIFVHVQTSWELDELHNVAISSPTTGQVLRYDGTLWRNAAVPAVTSVGLATSTTGVTITDTPVTSSGVININIATASVSNNGLLSASDWAAFNAKVGGSGTINYVPKFTAAGTIGNSQIFDNGTFVGIGTATPGAKLDVLHSNISAWFRSTGNPVPVSVFNSNSSVASIGFKGSTSTNEYNVRVGADGDNMVAYTNNTERLRITSGGLVGINTQSPVELLSLAGSAGTTFGYSMNPSGWNGAKHRYTVPSAGDESIISYNYNGSAVDFASYATSSIGVGNGVLRFSTGGTNAAPSERMRIFANGRVFIGASPTDAGYQLDVNGSVRSSGSFVIGTNGDTSPGAIFSNANFGFWFKSRQASPVVAHYQFGDYSGNPLMVINPSGNVGIGTATPTGTAERSINIFGSSTELHLTNTASGTAGADGFTLLYSALDAYLYNYEAGFISFGTSNAERLRISSAGVITVANLAGSGARLVVADASGNLSATTVSSSIVGGSGTTNYIPKFTASSTIGNSQIVDNAASGVSIGAKTLIRDDGPFVTGSNISGGANNMAIGTAGSGGFLQLYTNNTERLRITSGGNVGIGTDSPNDRLTIQSGTSVASAITFRANNVTSTSELFLGQAAGNEAYVYNRANQPMIFGTNNTERLRIFANGRVGVNTTTDAGYQFDINGTLRSVNGANFATNGTSHIGMGTVPSAWSWPNGVTQFRFGGHIAVADNSFLQLGTNSFYDGSNYVRVNAGYSSRYLQNDGGHFWSTAITSTAGSTVTFNEQMRMTSNGELLINTTTDAGDYKLQVSGNIYNTGSAVLAAAGGEVLIGTTTDLGAYKLQVNGISFFGSNANKYVLLNNTSSNAAIQAYGDWVNHLRLTYPAVVDFDMQVTAAGELDVKRSSNVVTRINAAGKFLINTTTDAGDYKLQVSGNIYNTGSAVLAATSGNVGIGTASPQEKLHISSGNFALTSLSSLTTGSTPATGTQKLILGGNSSNGVGNEIGWYPNNSFQGDIAQITAIATAFGSSAAGALLFRTNTNLETTPSEKMRITSAGNVGIGTATPVTRLDVFTTSTNGIDLRNTPTTIADQTSKSSPRLRLVSSRYEGGNVDAPFSFQNIRTGSPTNDQRLAITNFGDVEVLSITNLGFVGIGTTSPNERMTIQGAASAGAAITFRGNNATSSNEMLIGQGNANESYVYNRANQPMIFGTNNTERLRIFANGRIGVNTTTDAGYQFDVNGDVRFQGTLYTRAGTNTGIVMANTSAIRNTGTQYFDYGTGGTGDFYFRGGSGFADVLTLSNGGNVGIAITSPSYKLDINGTLRSVNGANFATTSGNIGIGTTSPGQKVEIYDGALLINRPSLPNDATNLMLRTQAGSDATLGSLYFVMNARPSATGSNRYVEMFAGDAIGFRNINFPYGNVGMGTTNPGARLDVAASVNAIFATLTNGGILLREFGSDPANNTIEMHIRPNAGKSGYLTFTENAVADKWAIGVQNGNTALRFLSGGAAGTERMRIFNNGRVAINTTTDAGYQLDVNGGTRVTGRITVTGNDTLGLSITRAGTSAISSEIYNGGGDNGWLLWGVESSAGGVIFPGTIAYASVVGSFRSVPLQFATNNTVRMTIDDGGSVGIGTASPVASAILQVDSTTKGMLPPRMTTTQRDAITSPATGLIVYDTTVNKLSVYNGTTWKYAQYE